MVMEASPSPQSVGREFVRQYYTLLNKAPAHLHRFYNNYSSFVHGGLDAPNHETPPVVGQKQIHHRIQQLNFRDCHAKISQVDSQATLGNGVVVQVTGELSNGGAPMRRFTQTFVLAAQSPKKYYVHNDIFRYQDIVFSDEEAEGSGRSEGEEEESAGGAAGGGGVYFAPPPGTFPPPPAAFPAPPPAPMVSPPPPAAPHPAPPPPHLNGHPPPHDLVVAMQGSSMSGAGSEPEAEGGAELGVAALEEPARDEPAPLTAHPPVQELERESTPPSHPASPPVSTEPKTYANLLKSGSTGGAGAAAPGVGAHRVSPPAPAHPPPEPRPRPQRAPRDPQPQGDRDRDRERGGAGGSGGGTGGGGGRYSDSQQLFLGNLPLSATEEELRALFARYGPVAELRVHSKPAAPGAPRHPNYGFITYETAHAASLCLNAAPLYFPVEGSAEGVKLNVEEKKARGREPPRRRPHSSHRAYPPRPAYRR